MRHSPFALIILNDVCTVYIKALDGKNIVQIASGQQHSIALDDTGYAVLLLIPVFLDWSIHFKCCVRMGL